MIKRAMRPAEKKPRRSLRRRSQSGFSLIEMMISILVISVVMGAIFGQVSDAQKISSGEAAKLDLFQESRAFVDQMTRDLRFTGYPNTHNYSSSQSPDQVVNPTAAGLVYLDVGDLWFEGSVDGSSQVYLIQYHLDSTCTPCPVCGAARRRSRRAIPTPMPSCC